MVGKGFTEWTNVRRGSPNFEGHYQPHIPSVLGYYDLRDPSVLQKQAELASSYGIYGFCFYYYWFSGTVLLDLPIQQITNTTDLNFPFCICWANENWTRRWDGKDQEILMSQNHSPEDDFAFIRKTEPIRSRKNYIRVGGSPSWQFIGRRSFQIQWLPLRDGGTTFVSRVTGNYISQWCAVSMIKHHPAPTALIPRFNSPLIALSNGGYGLIPKQESNCFTGRCTITPSLKKKIALNQLKAPHASAKNGYPGVMPSWDNTARCRGGGPPSG